MNVRNLKQMFQRQSTHKPEPTQKTTEKKQSPIVQQFLGFEAKQLGLVYTKTQQPEPQKIASKLSFLQELNRKIGKNNKIQIQQRTNHHEGKVPRSSTEKIIEKEENELNISEIIKKADHNNDQQRLRNIRYGINESYYKTGKTEKNDEGKNQDKQAFQAMLFEMLSNYQPNQSTLNLKNLSEKRKSRITNRYDYDSPSVTSDEKMKRINFVMDAVFGNTEFQDVFSSKHASYFDEAKPLPSKKEKQNVQIKEKKKEVKHQEFKIEQIVNEKKEEQPLEVINVTTMKRPSAVSNAFLNQLSLKLKQKQVQNQKSNEETPLVIQHHEKQWDKKQLEKPVQTESVNTRMKKKPQTHRIFEDN